MFNMEPGNMEETSTENAKISDSGYSNTCSNSQSHTSSETLPKPIGSRKDKGYKKKKSKKDLVSQAHAENSQTSSSIGSIPAPVANPHSILTTEPPCKPTLDKAKEEVPVVELVHATNQGVHNDNNLAPSTDAGLASKASLIDAESSSHSTEEYYAVISMQDGLVLHATPALHLSLGYPKDSWTGRLFIDLLDPRDKHVLTETIASVIASSREFCPTGANARKASIFCRLRKFATAASNQQSATGTSQYVPYRMNLLLQNFHQDKQGISQNQLILLVAFQPLHSAYKVPEETIIPTVFTTRHTATCQLSYVDPDVVQYLGYLPQDMIDRSLFDFYHPEDLPLIKEIYETVINLKGTNVRSKPYRFIAQNGCFVVLETEWSSFINPWTKSLEFVVGQHRVLKGPADPDVFRNSAERKNALLADISEAILREAKIIQKEIKSLLVEGVQRKPICSVTDSDLLSKKKEIASFVENILQEIKDPAPIKDHMAMDYTAFSEHDSVMLGEISPHHEYFDSKSSTETPPSYNQLNYNDNIERFFNSNLGASVNNRPDGSDEENLHSSANSSSYEPGKNNNSSPINKELKCTSSTNGSGNNGSAENLSSESNNQQNFGSGGETSNTTSNNSTTNGRFKPPILTESLLNRHNEDMEKLMIQKHREQKKVDKRNKSDQKAKADKIKSKTQLKRSASNSCEGHNHFKIAKYELNPSNNAKIAPTSADASANLPQAAVNASWPPMTVPSTTLAPQCFTTSNASCQVISRFPTFPQIFPFYYLPMSQPRDNPAPTAILQEHSGPPAAAAPSPYCFVPMPYMASMPSVMYPPIIGSPAPAAMMYRSYIVPEAPCAPANAQPVISAQSSCTPIPVPPTTTISTTIASSFDLKRPSSREASDKGEPRSSIALSESSTKMFSPSGVVSSCVSNEEGCFFSSSLNKSCDNSSNTYQRHTASTFEQYHKGKESRANQTRKAFGMVRKEPPWIEGVKLTPEIIYQYQISPKSLSNVLKTDLEFLKQSKQPSLVNDQLGQLFLDLDLEGFTPKLILEEAGPNSASDSSSDASQSPSRMGAW